MCESVNKIKELKGNKFLLHPLLYPLENWYCSFFENLVYSRRSAERMDFFRSKIHLLVLNTENGGS